MSLVDEINEDSHMLNAKARYFLNEILKLEDEGHRIELKSQGVYFIDKRWMVFFNETILQDLKTGTRETFSTDNLIKRIREAKK